MEIGIKLSTNIYILCWCSSGAMKYITQSLDKPEFSMCMVHLIRLALCLGLNMFIKYKSNSINYGFKIGFYKTRNLARLYLMVKVEAYPDSLDSF